MAMPEQRVIPALRITNYERSKTYYVTTLGFAVEWEPNVIRWYVDGILYQTRTPASLPAGTQWVYDHPHFMILNLAVGGGVIQKNNAEYLVRSVGWVKDKADIEDTVVKAITDWIATH